MATWGKREEHVLDGMEKGYKEELQGGIKVIRLIEFTFDLIDSSLEPVDGKCEQGGKEPWSQHDRKGSDCVWGELPLIIDCNRNTGK